MALLRGDVVLATGEAAARRGQSEHLAVLADAALRQAGCSPGMLAALAVTSGPGSFTGLRASMSLAEGMARALGLPLFGITVAEALAAAVRGPARDRVLWVAIASRPDRIFLARDGTIGACRLADLPDPDGPIALAGDAAEPVAALLAARGADVLLTDVRRPAAADVGRIAVARLAAGTAPAPVLPLYVDPPEARRAAGGRPAPLPGADLVMATPAHAAAMAAIHAGGFPPEQRWQAAAFASVLAQPGVFGWIDPAGAFVLARVAGDEAEILTLAVVAEARRRGRGRALVTAALARAARMGAGAAFLEVAAGNSAARALYAGLGFQAVGQRPAYYGDGGDALVLRATLSPAVTADERTTC